MPESRMTNNGLSFSFAETIKDSKDLLLLNTENSKNKKFRNYYVSVISDDYLLQNNIPQNQNFFYKIECFEKNNLKFAEIGVGEIVKKKSNYFLKREFSLYFDDSTGYDKTSGGLFYFPDNLEIICKTTIPEKYIDLFAYPFSVMCCTNPRIPNPVELEERTLLGRLENQIQSIDSSELRSILGDQNIVDAIESTNKPLSLQSKVVDLVNQDSSITAGSIVARPRNKQSVQKRRGKIIYDDETNCFYGYDGEKWRPLKWGDE